LSTSREAAPARLVLDTNVWLDWLVFDDPGIARLKAAVAGSHARIYIDGACLAEMARVLGYRLLDEPLDAAAQAAHRAACLRIACLLEEQERRSTAAAAVRLPACRDPDDQKFLELARDCRADALLTKDRALLELTRHRGRPLPFRIVTPDRYTG